MRSRCRYCEDVLAGIHWKKRNKKPCARLDGCVAKTYRARGKGVEATTYSRDHLGAQRGLAETT
jgi:hypothetical protein